MTADDRFCDIARSLMLLPLSVEEQCAGAAARPKADPASILRRPRTFLHLLPRAGAPSWIGRHRFPSQAARLTETPWRIEGLSALREAFAFASIRGLQPNTFASSHRWKSARYTKAVLSLRGNLLARLI
jgi:hypothetical protein